MHEKYLKRVLKMNVINNGWIQVSIVKQDSSCIYFFYTSPFFDLISGRRRKKTMVVSGGRRWLCSRFASTQTVSAPPSPSHIFSFEETSWLSPWRLLLHCLLVPWTSLSSFPYSTHHFWVQPGHALSKSQEVILLLLRLLHGVLVLISEPVSGSCPF